MLHLIKKDLLMQKKTGIASFFILIFFSFTFSDFGETGLVISTMAISYMLVYGAGLLEDKTNSDKMLASLPIRKQTIVLSKYVSVLVYSAYVLIVCLIIRTAAIQFHIPNFSFPVTPGAAAAAFFSVGLLFSLTFPLIFKFGYAKSRPYNFLLLFVIAFSGGWIAERWPEGGFAGKFLPDGELGAGWGAALALAVMVVAAAVSYRISLAFYRSREF
jgi:ABC-type transport system involved in multi-copper enzyme maturation permease subunit